MEEETQAPSPTPKPSTQSEQVAELYAALAKAQGGFAPALKDSENPHFRSRYADLASVWEACRAPLSANGLSVLQRPRTTPDGLWLETRLCHASGQWLSDASWWPVAQRTPQAYGSALTYARRYTLSALLGIAAEEDDDGNAASGTGQSAQQQSKPARQPAPKTTAPLKAAAPPADPPACSEEAEITALEAIAAADSQDALQALVPRLQLLEGSARTSALGAFKARKAALGGA
jgi:hypothetical protein